MVSKINLMVLYIGIEVLRSWLHLIFLYIVWIQKIDGYLCVCVCVKELYIYIHIFIVKNGKMILGR